MALVGSCPAGEGLAARMIPERSAASGVGRWSLVGATVAIGWCPGHGYRYLADEVATSKHDYYAGRGESPGVWAGSGCAELGLTGVVDIRDMDALYGRFVDPRTAGGAEVILGWNVSARVMHAGTPREYVVQPNAAFDVTFSPSKSVSALWAAHASAAVRQAVVDAHDAAVTVALSYLEDNAGHTRAGAGGLRRVESDGFIIATFRHRTSRSTDPDARVGDPQLHTHCAILNRIRGGGGVWRTLDSKAIYRHAHAAGALYGAVLERKLTARSVSTGSPLPRTPAYRCARSPVSRQGSSPSGHRGASR